MLPLKFNFIKSGIDYSCESISDTEVRVTWDDRVYGFGEMNYEKYTVERFVNNGTWMITKEINE